ncbi:MAG: Sorting nexin mvp1 [Phylliscum demangeonii]|nr:MAG: Sorting nexin mvp1 [Phylliscum demangeonii]
MSLFGESPDEAAPAKSVTLFDERHSAASQQSLFAEESQENATSTWSLATSKRPSPADLVKNLLPTAEVPERYVDLYDQTFESDSLSGGISLTGLRKVLQASGLAAHVQAQILRVVVPEELGSAQAIGQGVGRGQFNVLLALIGLGQEGEEATLDAVDERRRHLPIPSLTWPAPAPQASEAEEGIAASEMLTSKGSEDTNVTPSRARARPNDALGFPEPDPWSSPALHRGHPHPDLPGSVSKSNGSKSGADQPHSPADGRPDARTESSDERTPSGYHSSRPNPMHRGDTAGWAASLADRPGSGSGDGGFAPPDQSSGTLPLPLPSPGGGRLAGTSSQDTVVISVLPEKEGMFMFQHRNYQVSSVRRASKVIRRYSDFVWLLECLHKRYPFRQLPLLPPKRVAVNGTHLLSDVSFIEKRRRGLARFTNALVRHPVLSQEQLVVMFLTVPTELSVWRKQAAISVQEEFTGKVLSPTLEESLPANLMETFDTVRTGVRQSLEIYINLCGLVDRLVKRNEGFASDYLRLSLALQSLTETSDSTYAIDRADVPALNTGLQLVAKHLTTSQSLLEDESKEWDGGILEDVKRQRDMLLSARDLFDRYDRLARDSIPALERRIEQHESKLATLRARPDGSVKAGEIQKTEESIVKDKQSIVAQHARTVFIKECIRDELRVFHASQYHVSRLHQHWSQARVKFAELQAENWRALSDAVDSVMPLGEEE